MVSIANGRGLALQSDTARTESQVVAVAACLGLITTLTEHGYGRLWRPTSAGLAFLESGELE